MNPLISYIILGVGILLLILGFIMKQNNKKTPAVVSLIIGIIAVVVFCVMTVSGKSTLGDSARVVKSREGALGYGIGSVLSQKVPEAKVVDVITYGSAEKWSSLADAVKMSIPDATVNLELISDKEPLFYRADKKMIKDFMTKAVKESKADLIVINIGVPLEPTWFPSSFKGKIIVVTLSDIPDTITKKGIVLGTIKLNPSAVAEKISSDPEKAFREQYIFSAN